MPTPNLQTHGIRQPSWTITSGGRFGLSTDAHSTHLVPLLMHATCSHPGAGAQAVRSNCGLAGVQPSFQKCSSFLSKGTLSLTHGGKAFMLQLLVQSLLAAQSCDPTLARRNDTRG